MAMETEIITLKVPTILAKELKQEIIDMIKVRYNDFLRRQRENADTVLQNKLAEIETINSE